MRAKVKITVLRKLYHGDLYERFAETAGEPCSVLEEGQEFVVPEHIAMPEGFCAWAWTDIMKYVLTLGRGGNLLGKQ